MTIKILEKDENSLIEKFLDQQNARNIFQYPIYGEVVENAYEVERCYIGKINQNGKLIALLPLYICPHFPFGTQAVTIPYSAWHSGFYFETEQDQREIIEFATNYLNSKNVLHIEVREKENFKPIDRAIINDSSSLFVLDITKGKDDLFKNSFDTKLRNQIRKSQTQNFSFSIGGLELLNDFYLVYFLAMKNLGSPPHTKAYFRELISKCSTQMYIALTYKEKLPVAGLWLLKENNRVFNPWAGSLDEYKKDCVNNFMYWNAICWSVDQQCIEFDFGRSQRGGSHNKFKLQWGVREEKLKYISYLVKSKNMAPINPDSPQIRLFRKIWSMLPNIVISHITKFFIRKVP